MKRILLMSLACVLAGCGEQQQPAATDVGASAVPAAATAKQPIPLPDFGQGSRLALVRRSGSVRIGANMDVALTVFAEPPGSYEKSDLPPGIAPPYESRIWQTKNEGFGMILFKGQVAAAIYELDRTGEERLQELLGLEQDVLGQGTALPGKFVRYWFWKAPAGVDQLVMLCAAEIQPGRINVTEAIGTQALMDALAMTPEAASRNQATAEKLIEKQRSGGNKPNPSNSTNLTPG